MIYYSVPYSIEKNLGKYYNDFMKILPSDDDYGCFVDGDTMFTTTNYGHIINNITQENPDVGCFTCYTNRIGCNLQIAPGVDQNINDMDYHRKFGLSLQTIFGTECIDVSNRGVMSGHLMLLKKSLWKKIGGFLEEGMLGVDNDLFWKVNKHNEKIYLMKGIYIFHWYRWPNSRNKSHLI